MVCSCFGENCYISLDLRCIFLHVPLRKEEEKKKKNAAQGSRTQCFFGQSCIRHDFHLLFPCDFFHLL